MGVIELTLEAFVQILKNTGLPVAHYQFSGSVKLPCLVYVDKGTNNYNADDTVYQEITNIDIELYAVRRDKKAERKLEAALTMAGIVYERTGTFYIDSERVFETIYEIQIIEE